MTSGFEPVLHALELEPRLARPGDAVRIAFRTRNAGGVASPGGTVRFLLPAGLELLARGESDGDVGNAEVSVDPAAPGETVVAEVCARVSRPMDDGTRLAVQAVFETGDAVLGTNVCAVVVTSRPVLDGPRSGTFVEALDALTVRVRAVVTNEGDGPANDVLLVVPAPEGSDPLETASASHEIARLDAGDSIVTTFDARVSAEAGVLRVDDAVAIAGGVRWAIPARAEAVLVPSLARPEVELAHGRRRIEVAAAVRNDGWADARDVRVRVALPAPVQLDRGNVSVDGTPIAWSRPRRKNGDASFARLEWADGGAHLAIGRIAARSTVRILVDAPLAAAAFAGFPAVVAGDAVVQLDESEPVVVPFVLQPVRDVRARIVGVPRRIAAGDVAAIVIELANRGDVAETLEVALVAAVAGGEIVGVTQSDAVAVPSLAPGRVAVVSLVLTAPEGRAGATSVHVTARVRDENGERARVERTVALRVAHGDEPAASPASRDADGATTVPSDATPACRGTIAAPPEAIAGTAFALTAILDVAARLETLIVRVAASTAAEYVPGSTRIDGCVVLDRDGASALHGAGLTLRDVPPSTRVTLTWSMLARAGAGAEVAIAAVAIADEVAIELAPATVALRAGCVFPVRPAALPYHVDACTASAPAGALAKETVALPDAEPPAVPHRPAEFAFPWTAAGEPAVGAASDSPPVWTLRFDAARAVAIARAMRGSRDNSLVAHVAALRALLPDADPSHDAGTLLALDDVRDAARDVLERLFVKLRIPGFTVAASDLEDAPLRAALIALFRRTGAMRGAAFDPAGDARAASYDGVPLGSAAALRRLVSVMPTRCEEHPVLAAALRFYGCALDEALARAGDDEEAFRAALQRDAGFALEDARAGVAAECLAGAALAGAA